MLKLFRAWCPADWVEYEAQVARTVHRTGLVVPAVGDVVEVEGRWGIVYERAAHVRLPPAARGLATAGGDGPFE